MATARTTVPTTIFKAVFIARFSSPVFTGTSILLLPGRDSETWRTRRGVRPRAGISSNVA